MINRNVLAAFVLGSACLAGPTAAEPLDLFGPAAEIDEVYGGRRRDLIARQWDLNLQFYGWGGYNYGPSYVERFEPWWQGLPGSMWGYRQQWPTAQPIGHKRAQAGPNRRIYRSLYASPEDLPRGEDIATPTGAGPQLPTPAEPVQGVFRPAGWRKNKRPPGTREFSAPDFWNCGSLAVPLVPRRLGSGAGRYKLSMNGGSRFGSAGLGRLDALSPGSKINAVAHAGGYARRSGGATGDSTVQP